ISKLKARHIQVNFDENPSLTFYFSGYTNRPNLNNFSQIKKHINRLVLNKNLTLNANLDKNSALDLNRRKKSTAISRLYEDGDIADWKIVLGPQLHYHSGIF